MQLIDSGNYVPQVKFKKQDGLYVISYLSPVTGKLKRAPVKRTGKFPTTDAASEWAQKNLASIIGDEIKYSERYTWRSDAKMLRYFNEYKAWRKIEYPRSSRVEFSMLKNYGIHFFISVAKIPNPNNWYLHGEDFVQWLSTKAKTQKGTLLSASSCNVALSTINEFMRWMKRKRIIKEKNFQKFERFDRRKVGRRGAKDLVSDETFEKIHARLKAMSQLYADCWYVQRRLGCRVSELIGLPFNSVSHLCPQLIRDEFEGKGCKVYGSVYLESQPDKPYITRVRGAIERSGLKSRPEIGPDYARTIPILDSYLWNILVERSEIQRALWKVKHHGRDVPEESYLLFDGAQARSYRKAIREAYQLEGLGDSKGTHVLRHSLATEFASMKIDRHVAEVVLGHKGDAHDLYVHLVGQISLERLKLAMIEQKLEKVNSTNDTAAAQNTLHAWNRQRLIPKAIPKSRFRATIRSNIKSVEKDQGNE